jgi:hypothetical protein
MSLNTPTRCHLLTTLLAAFLSRVGLTRGKPPARTPPRLASAGAISLLDPWDFVVGTTYQVGSCLSIFFPATPEGKRSGGSCYVTGHVHSFTYSVHGPSGKENGVQGT